MNPKPTPPRSAGRRGWLLLATGLLAATLVAALRWLTDEPATAHRDQPALVPPDAGGTLQAAAPVGPDQPAQRTAAVAAAVAAPRLSFEAQIERLVAIGHETAAFVASDEIESAKASDARARAAYGALMDGFPDAGERGLQLLSGQPHESAAPDDVGRRIVLRLVIAGDCSRRHDVATATGDRSRIDPLVAALLAVLPQHPKVAALGDEVLADRPFLRLVHEPAVLDLVTLAGEQRFPREVATRLLLTLWDNLQRAGERTSAELASLAMVLLADADPSKRTAACRQLLADPRYRHVVLAWLRERGDRAVATEVAALAARELPPADALQVLRELAPALRNMPNAYMLLGHRAPDALVDAYHELLAANTHAAVRSDMIAGLAMANAPESLPAVELALQSDPAPEVRMQAMLSLTATAAATRGEEACNRILDDPALAADPARLGLVVFALQNLEVAGLVNAVDRLGQRLRNTPLRDDSRKALEQLLARALPADRPGGTPR